VSVVEDALGSRELCSNAGYHKNWGTLESVQALRLPDAPGKEGEK